MNVCARLSTATDRFVPKQSLVDAAHQCGAYRIASAQRLCCPRGSPWRPLQGSRILLSLPNAPWPTLLALFGSSNFTPGSLSLDPVQISSGLSFIGGKSGVLLLSPR